MSAIPDPEIMRQLEQAYLHQQAGGTLVSENGDEAWITPGMLILEVGAGTVVALPIMSIKEHARWIQQFLEET